MKYIGLSFFDKKSFYKGKKQLYIKELTIEGVKDGEKTVHTYADVVIDFALKCVYYTDAITGKQFIKQEGQPIRETREYLDNYQLLYPDPLTTNPDIIEKQVKRVNAQRLEQIIMQQKAAVQGQAQALE